MWHTLTMGSALGTAPILGEKQMDINSVLYELQKKGYKAELHKNPPHIPIQLGIKVYYKERDGYTPWLAIARSINGRYVQYFKEHPNLRKVSQLKSDLEIEGNLIVTGNISGNGGSVDLTAVTTSIIPDTSGAYDLGSSDKPFRDVYVTNNSIHMGSTVLSISAGRLQVGNEPLATVFTVPVYPILNAMSSI